jgi:hypothetical protein
MPSKSQTLWKLPRQSNIKKHPSMHHFKSLSSIPNYPISIFPVFGFKRQRIEKRKPVLNNQFYARMTRETGNRSR